MFAEPPYSGSPAGLASATTCVVRSFRIGWISRWSSHAGTQRDPLDCVHCWRIRGESMQRTLPRRPAPDPFSSPGARRDTRAVAGRAMRVVDTARRRSTGQGEVGQTEQLIQGESRSNRTGRSWSN